MMGGSGRAMDGCAPPGAESAFAERSEPMVTPTPRWWVALPLAVVALAADPGSAIRDEAGMFGKEAVRRAREALERIEKDARVTVVIETIDSLDGEDIDAASLRRAKASGAKGIFILIAKQERKIEVRDYRSFLGRDRRLAIRDAILEGFQKGDFDAGLSRGIARIRRVLSEMGRGPILTARPRPDEAVLLRI
jgi:uncharacterized membrane protein YgcG